MTLEIDADDGLLTIETNSSNPTVQWFFEGDSIEDAVEEFYIPLEDGNYSVEIVDEYGCALSDSIYAVGLTEILFTDLSVYPNPSQGIVHVKYSFETLYTSSIKVVSLIGELLYQETVEARTNVETSLPLDNVASGVYMLSIEVNGLVYNHKLIIQH